MNSDTQTNDSPAMNGDDELAKTLSNGLKFEDIPGPINTDDPNTSSDSDDTPPSMSDMPTPADTSQDDVPQATANTEDASDDQPSIQASSTSSDLDQIKSSALDGLKPLVGKLNLNPEEKFDTLLLIIRSTDDQSLLPEAHEAAKQITDDTKRAQALLDVIKEVDYFNNKQQ